MSDWVCNICGGDFDGNGDCASYHTDDDERAIQDLVGTRIKFPDGWETVVSVRNTHKNRWDIRTDQSVTKGVSGQALLNIIEERKNDK